MVAGALRPPGPTCDVRDLIFSQAGRTPQAVVGEDAAKEAVGQVIRALIQERRVLSQHSEARMDERGISMNDIHHALVHATEVMKQPVGTWRITGPDRDGDPVVIIVDIGDRVRIVTVM
jgi:hypothetical protein